MRTWVAPSLVVLFASGAFAATGCAQSDGGGFGGGAGGGAGGGGNFGGFGATDGGAGASGSSGFGAVGGTAGSGGFGASAGTAGTSGSGGTAGTAGTAGTSGSGGTAGTAGTSGTAGTAGTSGGGGTAGTAGTGGTAGTSGSGGTGGSTGQGDCCNATLSVSGCTNAGIETCVCAQDSFCCSTEWDSICAGETLLLGCGTCPTPADCCSAGSCSSDAIVECVGDTDFGCYTSWDSVCASEVNSLACGSCGTTPTAAVWINEIHYDNDGADTGEGVEVAGAAGTSLAGWSLVFYNGGITPPSSYATTALSGTIPSQQNGYGTVWVAVSGVQNGTADGVALVDASNQVVQFLSYEGTLTASDGPAAGKLSTDIGVAESPTTPVGQSLGLTGTGHDYSAFTWAGPATATPGQPNGSQTFN